MWVWVMNVLFVNPDIMQSVFIHQPYDRRDTDHCDRESGDEAK
jgi:hypothetical protein